MSDRSRQSLYVGDGTTCQERGAQWPELLDRVHLINPKGYISGIDRIFRGGSWNNYASDLRSALRNYDSPKNRYSNIGFRLLRIR